MLRCNYLCYYTVELTDTHVGKIAFRLGQADEPGEELSSAEISAHEWKADGRRVIVATDEEHRDLPEGTVVVIDDGKKIVGGPGLPRTTLPNLHKSTRDTLAHLLG